jgi:mRNA-degrading endonuclease toxin of MazEF toxin-antitoxin module
MKSPCAINLHNVITIPKEKLGKRVSQLNTERMKELCRAIRFSLGCD